MQEELTKSILREIETLSEQGVLMVRNEDLEHLSKGDDMLGCLLSLRGERLISGNLITIGVARSTPYRMTDIRLTVLGHKLLRSSAGVYAKVSKNC